MKNICILKVIFFVSELYFRNKSSKSKGKNTFKCVVLSNVCGDGGHIIRLPEYRPRRLCIHNAENLKFWQAPSRTTLITSVLWDFCIHFPVFVFLVSLLLMSLNVTGCYIRVYMISNNRVTCVIAANYASGLVLKFKIVVLLLLFWF